MRRHRETWQPLKIALADLDQTSLSSDLPTAFNVRLSSGGPAGEEVRGALAGEFGVREAGTAAGMLVFLDTFEWSLWFAGLVLWEQDGHLRLAARENDWIGAELAALPLEGGTPRFARDFPDSPLGDAVRPLIGLRALLPVARIEVRHALIELLDANRKTVLRLDLQEVGDHSGRVIVAHARLLRGYEPEAARAAAVLARFAEEESVEGPLIRAFRRLGKEPRVYTLRPGFELAADLPAREAVRHIVSRVLAIARENERGIIEDVDTEFLHDARICIRKIRAVLSLLKGVYPLEETQRLKDAFSRLGRETNRLRDLDVELLARPDLAARLPGHLRAGLDEMFADFAAERTEQQQRVAARLGSDGHRREMEALARFFGETDGLAPSAASAAPVGPLAAAQICRRYRKIRKLARRLRPETPDHEIHALRVQAKKLRYLLEFFSELFDAEKIQPLEKHLRRLQNRLGCFNDLAVQQRSLLAYWAARRETMVAPVETAMSLGGLIALLHRDQEEERKEVHAALEEFASGSVAARFAEIFRRPENVESTGEVVP
jgi:CHAD domain-containing protein